MRSRSLANPDSHRRSFVSILVALALPLAGLGGLGPAPVAADVTPITGPIVITEPGDYRIMADFTVSDPSGDAIVVRASGVRVALGGRTITGPGNKQGRGIVIEGAQGVEIVGGTLRTFGIGVALLDAGSSTVRGVAIEGGDEFADPPAVAPQIGILLVDSARNTIRENRIDRVNLGIFVRGGGSYENRIAQNIATAGFHGLLGICYNPASGAGPAGPQRDQVLRNTLDGFDRGIQASEESSGNRFIANVIRFLTLAYDDRNGGNRFVGNQSTDLTP